MEVRDADRRKEWSTSQSGMTQTVGTDADIIGVPRSVLAAACYIIHNSEHAESETAKAMRKYALSTQASELDALRGEVERQENLAAVYRRAQLNTEEKLKRETCNSEGWKKRAQHLEATIAQLRDRVAGLEEGLRCTLAYLPSTLGVTQRVRALLTQNEVG